MKNKEHEKIVGLINSEEYSLFKNEWRDFLGRAVYGEKGMQRVRDAASEVIKNAYAKIVKDGRKLDNSSPASDIHKVRIGCKKLRYALEFFRPIFPSKQGDAVTKKLKTLQDSLGAHQDYEVQREKLLRYTEEAAKGMKDKVNLSLASGYLARYLDELKCSERERCLEMIDSFISDKVRAQIKEMIK
jgi:CHAD domain-containing protein